MWILIKALVLLLRIVDLGLRTFLTGAPGGPNGCDHDPQEFIGLPHEIPNMGRRDKSSLNSHLKPILRFVQFFLSNSQLSVLWCAR